MVVVTTTNATVGSAVVVIGAEGVLDAVVLVIGTTNSVSDDLHFGTIPKSFRNGTLIGSSNGERIFDRAEGYHT